MIKRVRFLMTIIILLLLCFFPAAAVAESIVVGTVEDCSSLPNPVKNDYPDCDFIAVFHVKKIISGEPVPEKILVVVPGFENRKLFLPQNVKSGANLRIKLVTVDSLSENRRSRQRSDDIMDPLLEEFFVCATDSVEPAELEGKSPVPFAKENTAKIETPHEVAVDKEAQTQRKKSMEADLALISEKLKRRDAAGLPRLTYSAKMIEMAAQKESFWIDNRLILALTPQPEYFDRKEINQSLLGALRMLNKECQSRGVDLIVLFVPEAEELYAPYCVEPGSNTDDIFSYDRLALMQQALLQDIEVIDLLDAFRQNAHKYPQLTMITSKDGHWDSGALKITAEQVKERLQRYSFCQKSTQNFDWGESMQPDREQKQWPSGSSLYQGIVQRPFVTSKGKPYGLATSEKAPILLLGDSFANAPYVTGGNLAAWIALNSNCDVDNYLRYGSLKLITELQKDQCRQLVDRKVCILVFSPGYLRAYWYYFDSTLLDKIRNSDLIFSRTGKDFMRADSDGAITVEKTSQELKYTVRINALPESAYDYRGFVVKILGQGENGIFFIFRGPLLLRCDLSFRKDFYMDIPSDYTKMKKYGLTFYIRYKENEMADAALTELKVYGVR